MPKGIATIDEKDLEMQMLKQGVQELEKRIEKLEGDFSSISNPPEQLNGQIKALHQAALELMKRAHEAE
jgi:peptidoglycan hydrolase CwlO-like protein